VPFFYLQICKAPLSGSPSRGRIAPHNGSASLGLRREPHNEDAASKKPLADRSPEKDPHTTSVTISSLTPHNAPLPGCATSAASEVAQHGRSGIISRATWQKQHQRSRNLAGPSIRGRRSWQRGRVQAVMWSSSGGAGTQRRQVGRSLRAYRRRSLAGLPPDKATAILGKMKTLMREARTWTRHTTRRSHTTG
jgi:hypothetical protein